MSTTRLLSLALALSLPACTGRPPEPVTRAESQPEAPAQPETQGMRSPHDSEAQPVGSQSGPSFVAQEGWIEEQPENAMRKAQYRLPAVEGDSEDATLRVFYAPGGMGPNEQNIMRWCSEYAQPDGSSSRDAADVREETIAGNRVTLLDVSGTNRAETTPGSGDRVTKHEWRTLAAIVEVPGEQAPYYVKLSGPAPTVDRWSASFRAFLEAL